MSGDLASSAAYPSAAAMLQAAKKIVIKIGSATVVDAKTGQPRIEWLSSLAEDVKELQAQGKSVVIVTSGAIALGRHGAQIGLDSATKTIRISKKQAAAAIGQPKLMQLWGNCLAAHDLQVAQVLLTPHDTCDQETAQNAINAINELLQLGVVPVINENDTTATAEIRIGDNDLLAARVLKLIGAGMLIIMSTTDGLYTDDPHRNPHAQHIPLIDDFTKAAAYSRDAPPGLSTGGMCSKIEAARIAHYAGGHVIITQGDSLNPLRGLLAGKRATIIPAGPG